MTPVKKRITKRPSDQKVSPYNLACTIFSARMSMINFDPQVGDEVEGGRVIGSQEQLAKYLDSIPKMVNTEAKRSFRLAEEWLKEAKERNEKKKQPPKPEIGGEE